MAKKDVYKMAKEYKCKFMDLRFTDLPGQWQHTSYPISEMTPDNLKDGFGFDGSSIRGFQSIESSDMMIVPDTETAFIDPFFEVPTLVMYCDIVEPDSRKPYSRDPRFVAKKAEAYIKKAGVGDTVYFGPEAEFFVFNSVRYANDMNSAFFEVESAEAVWNTSAEESGSNLGYKIRTKGGYFPVPPSDSMQDMRSEMVMTMEDLGIAMECHHHEVATAGQAEIDIRYETLTKTADNLMLYKYVTKNVARKRNLSATFMPKPLHGDNGSGMHTHISIWEKKKPTFYDAKGPAGLSKNALYFIGGMIKHGAAVLAFAAPTTNSYKRLTPGYEAPVNLVYSTANRSAAFRIPMYSKSPNAKRIEFRCPDPTCNPYLAFAAMLMAGLDGIKNKIDPGQPVNEDLFSMDAKKLAKIKTVPSSLAEALDALKKDHAFLLEGGVFTQDVIDKWIEYKTENEVEPIRLRTTPLEFEMYYDI